MKQFIVAGNYSKSDGINYISSSFGLRIIVQIAFRPAPGPERGSSKRGCKEKSHAHVTTSFPHFFRSALQDPDVLLVPHRFAFHMEREAIINMKQVSDSGPHQPVVQSCTGDHNNVLEFTEISNSIPSVAAARPILIDTCRPSGLSFFSTKSTQLWFGFSPTKFKSRWLWSGFFPTW